MSQDELVDILNEQGEVVQTVMKREAHEKGLLHKTVIGEIIDHQGRWLLVKQSSDRQDAGQYVSPVGGHVSAGETEDQALKREAQEEVGFTEDFKYKYVGREIFNRNVLNRQENHLFVMYEIFSDKEPVLGNEAESCAYFTQEELKRELKENPQNFGNAFHFVVKTFFPDLGV